MYSNCIFVLALVGFSFAQRPPYSESDVSHDNRTVLLGGLFPLSENLRGKCGKLRPSAVASMEAMVFTIRQINENSSLLPGINLTYDIRDTCAFPNRALEQSLGYVYNTLSRGGETDNLAISGIVGAGAYSEVSKAVASFFRLFQIPQISYGSTESSLSDRTQYDYFFRTVPPDSYLAQAMGDAVNYFQWSYIITLHSDDDYGLSGLNVILKTVQAKGSADCIAKRIPLPVGTPDPSLYDSIADQMNLPWVRNATVALLFGYPEQTVLLMEAIQRLVKRNPDSPIKDLTWVGCDALVIDKRWHYLLHGMIRMQISVKGSDEFQNHFSTLTHRNATNADLYREYYEVMNNCSFNSSSMPCDYTDREPYDQRIGISSVVDAVYAFAHALHGLVEARCSGNGLCHEILVRRHPTGFAVNGTLIREYLLNNISFPGLSSHTVSFDEHGNDMSSYTVKNLQKKRENYYEYIPVGTWTPDKLFQLTENEVEYNGGKKELSSFCSSHCQSGFYAVQVPDRSECCWMCYDCPGDNTVSEGLSCVKCAIGSSPNANRSRCEPNEVSYLRWSDTWALIALLCASAGIALTAFVAVIYAIFNQNRIIKASSRDLSAILIIGLVLCYILPFLFVAKPSAAICGVRRFFVGFSFAVCFSALLVKTNRIHRIFNRSPEQLAIPPRFVSSRSQIVIVLILLSVQVVMNTLWLGLQHPNVQHVPNGRTTELRCQSSSDIELLVWVSYNLLLLILSTYFAFLARKIPENFNEAKFINVTLYSIIIVWLAFIPAYIATANVQTVFQTVFLIAAIVLSASTTLFCLFMPKIFLLFNEMIKTKKENMEGTVKTNQMSATSGMAMSGPVKNFPSA